MKAAKISGKGRAYRWCEQREQYVALSVCKRLAQAKGKCGRCLADFQQMPLPFGEKNSNGRQQ